MSAQTITTPSGDRLIVLPEAEFTALVEAADDAADRAAVRLFRERLANGDEDLVPADVLDRLLAGENRLRVWREHRGLTMTALAEAADVPEAMLAGLERSEDEGRLATLRKVSAASR